eukprot:scaffold1398_cov259-Pinguiococcus_pyrenoidosus.AAC.9
MEWEVSFPIGSRPFAYVVQLDRNPGALSQRTAELPAPDDSSRRIMRRAGVEAGSGTPHTGLRF